MNDIFEIPQIIDLEYQKKILDTVTDIKFPWHYMEDTTYEYKGATKLGSTPAFGHLLFSGDTRSEYLDLFTPLMMTGLERCGLNLVSVLRLRLGFLLNTVYPLPSFPYKHNEPHVDFDIDHYTMLYYINKTDGPTVIFKETEPSEIYTPMRDIVPQKGKLACFNGRHFHASTCPKMTSSRIVLTMNVTATKK